MALILIPPKIQFFDNDGNPLAGGKVYTYAAGTSIPKITWKDEAETQQNANPVILDSRGEAVIRLNGSYKINVTDKNDVQIPGYPIDNISQYNLRDWTGLTASIADLNSTTTTVLPKTADYTITLTDRGKTIAVDATGGVGGKVTVSGLSAASLGNGYKIIVKKTDKSANYVAFLPVDTETIDTEAAEYRLYDVNDFAEFQSDGSNWIIVAARVRGTTIVATTTANPTFNDNNTTWLLNATSGAFQVNLLASNYVGRGYAIAFKKTDSSTNQITIKPDGAETIDEKSEFLLKKQYDFIWLISDGNNWFAIGEYGAEGGDEVPRGYIDGLVIEQDSGDTQHDILFSTGICRDRNDIGNLKLSSGLVKRIDANWVAGTGNGGFPSGLTLTANTWYHTFVIGKTDGTTDAGFDSNIDATNLLSDATGYTLYRRVGSIRTDGSANITNFRQEKDLFYWIVPRNDVSIVNPGTSIITSTISVPPNVYSEARINLRVDTTASALTDLELRMAPTFVTLSVACDILHLRGATIVSNMAIILADTSSQIHWQLSNSNSTTAVDYHTQGWRDFRGQDFK